MWGVSKMALKIFKVDGDYYKAEVTPPHTRMPWNTPQPIRLRELIDALVKQGCHQTDIGDVLYEIDPDWLSHLNDAK